MKNLLTTEKKRELENQKIMPPCAKMSKFSVVLATDSTWNFGSGRTNSSVPFDRNNYIHTNIDTHDVML